MQGFKRSTTAKVTRGIEKRYRHDPKFNDSDLNTDYSNYTLDITLGAPKRFTDPEGRHGIVFKSNQEDPKYDFKMVEFDDFPLTSLKNIPKGATPKYLMIIVDENSGKSYGLINAGEQIGYDKRFMKKIAPHIQKAISKFANAKGNDKYIFVTKTDTYQDKNVVLEGAKLGLTTFNPKFIEGLEDMIADAEPVKNPGAPKAWKIYIDGKQFITAHKESISIS